MYKMRLLVFVPGERIRRAHTRGAVRGVGSGASAEMGLAINRCNLSLDLSVTCGSL